MNLKIQKMEQGPVLADKGDVDIGSAGGAGPVTVGTGDNSRVGVGVNSSLQPAIGYSCDF